MKIRRSSVLWTTVAVLLLILGYSGLAPFDRTTWVLEIFPIVVALPIVIFTYRSFPLTSLLYACLVLHALVLILGGAYSYARVPLGFQIAQWLDLSRNPYDKIGHFFQGFVPALIAREVFIRGSHIRSRRVLPFVVISVVLSISAVYELIEWAAALLLGQGAEEFLGTQGDPWDTQSDMFLALIGAVVALLYRAQLFGPDFSIMQPAR